MKLLDFTAKLFAVDRRVAQDVSVGFSLQSVTSVRSFFSAHGHADCSNAFEQILAALISSVPIDDIKTVSHDLEDLELPWSPFATSAVHLSRLAYGKIFHGADNCDAMLSCIAGELDECAHVFEAPGSATSLATVELPKILSSRLFVHLEILETGIRPQNYFENCNIEQFPARDEWLRLASLRNRTG